MTPRIRDAIETSGGRRFLLARGAGITSAVLYGACFMQFAFFTKVRGISRILSAERTDVNIVPCNTNCGSPATFIEPYSKEATCIVCACFSSVVLISLRGNIPEILNSIVMPLTVDMVNLAIRPNTMRIEPSKPVSFIPFPINSNHDVPIRVKAGTNISSFYTRTSSYKSGENSSFFIVMKQRFKSLWGKICDSHSVVPSKQWVGQRPQCVTSMLGLRHFSLTPMEAI